MSPTGSRFILVRPWRPRGGEMSPAVVRGGYIKIWRILLEDPLWTQVPTACLRVALAILLTATWKSTKWFDGAREIELPAGSLVTSRPSMCKLARVTPQQYRDALTYLEQTRFLTSKKTNRYTVLSVSNWARYQSEVDSREPAQEPAKNQQRTTSEEVKKVKTERTIDSIRSSEFESEAKPKPPTSEPARRPTLEELRAIGASSRRIHRCGY